MSTIVGCMNVSHNEENCLHLDEDHRCSACWAQTATEWNVDKARELARAEILDASDAEDEEEQIQAGVAWMQELFTERRAAVYLEGLKRP